MPKISYWLTNRILPGLKSAHWHYKEILQNHVKKGIHWLDLGCGHNFFPNWLGTDEQKKLLANKPRIVVGIDSYRELYLHPYLRYKVAGNISYLPFKDNSFDLLTAQMVMEHISEPRLVLNEGYRVLKPGGLFLFHTPNYYYYIIFIASFVPQRLKNWIITMIEGREETDIFPTKYRINTDRAIRLYANKTGFKIKELFYLNTTPITLFLGFLALFELLILKLLLKDNLAKYRSNIMVILEKPK